MNYQPTDTIEKLLIKFFKQHIVDMMFQTHGYWQPKLWFTPDQARLLVSNGLWNCLKEISCVRA